jgi:SIR2-like domain
MVHELDSHYSNIISSIFDNKIVFFLGSGINMLDRPENENWKFGETNYFPNSEELITYLSTSFNIAEKYSDLIRVSQYASIIAGRGRLIDKLCDIFIPKENNSYQPYPNRLHKFFAQMPSTLRKFSKKEDGDHNQLMVTPNYDDLLEQSFRNENEPYDLITYNTHGENIAGKFIHKPYQGNDSIIKDPNTYDNLPIDIEDEEAVLRRTIILKIHGAINRIRRRESSFVITEDDYRILKLNWIQLFFFT